MKSFGVLSETFDHYRWLLRLASIFLENYTITWNARYRQLVNAIMLMNTVVILRGTSVTFDHYRWLLRLASIFIKTYTITWNARYRQLVNTIMLMNTLAILRGTFGNFRPLSSTTSACVSLHRDLYHYLKRALSPTCERYNVNEHPRNPSGYYSSLLRLASIFLENYTITWNARYRQLVNAIMLIITLAILRGAFGNFWPRSLTTSTCVNLPRELYHYLEHALSRTFERCNVNEHRRYSSGYFR